MNFLWKDKTPPQLKYLLSYALPLPPQPGKGKDMSPHGLGTSGMYSDGDIGSSDSLSIAGLAQKPQEFNRANKKKLVE